MLPKQFFRKVEGFYDLLQLKERNEWERARWQTCILLNVHLPKGKMVKPKDLLKFDNEKHLDSKEDIEKIKDRAEYLKQLDQEIKKGKNGK